MSPANTDSVNLEAFFSALGGALGADGINRSEVTIRRYGENTMPGGDRPPAGVVYPGSTADVQIVVRAANKYNVPLYVGEFGCDASDKDQQVQWVNACVALFEQNNLHWTYWNDRETSDPNGMGLHAEHRDGSDCPVNKRLLSALRTGWRLNHP